ncbi:hypothetical protein MPTK1_1g03670 [Marchantia polymorpha subsp. ruderalis]|uniref:Uncharacterized protein n=2 Tax=Marchantia polymorpha TaxID=3197 RepID=A0AAF6AL65_MARPO|nr:hypothetical protein MARPO_0005s0241 [Marchantia polymorpha]BBM97185.1 hypothetical protein Mp_1g03670 [Marchantia polymorpha subsp. ruderalis]|eukprot:PTQ48622.1 hypothetical protein MARPO_0005s0241 [Marchantia polymorpha]
MLLESALADFSEESTNASGHPSAMPYVWDDKSGKQVTRSSSYHERISKLSVQENEGLHLHEEAADMFNARKSNKSGAAHSRSDSGQFYHKEGTVPFKWEAAPGKPVVAQEPVVNCESPRLRPPPALRNVAIPLCSSPRHGGIAGKMKSILSGGGGGGKVVPKNAGGHGSFNSSTGSISKSGSDREQWSSSSGRDDTDRDSSVDSDGGEESSPVSTLDRPASPLSPACSPKVASPKHHELAVASYRHGHGSSNLRNVAAPVAHSRPPSQMAHCLLAMTEISEELPMIEEDEEDSEYHTMEFPTVDSPGTIEERRERSLLRRPGSSKSMSAPLARRQSSLGASSAANRQRRRSDFDWPEDFDERPEEVVKEVDESLWAFSPVASTFVFSGNDNSAAGSGRSPGRHAPGTGASPSSSGSGSGSLRETLSLRRTLMRSSSTKNGFSGKSSAEAAAVHVEVSGHLGGTGRLKYRDDEEIYPSSRGHRMKRSLSCIPFLNLCRAHRPTPAISFSHRLSPNVASTRK